jgi:hypothetical protein
MGRIILSIQVLFLPLLSAFSRLVNYCLARRNPESRCFSLLSAEALPPTPPNPSNLNPESRLKRLLSGLCSIRQQFTVRLKAESKGKKAIYRGGLSC